MSTLYAGGLVFDGHKLLLAHGVLVEGERIRRVAPMAEFQGFSGTRIDTGGATILPGLMDCHVHLCYAAEPDPGTAADKLRPGDIAVRALEHAQKSLHGGITAVRDCGGKDYLEFAARDACNSGRFLGPTIRAAGRMICMTGGHGNRIARIADGIDEVVRAVREQVHAGSDFCKIMATGGVMTPGVNPEDAHYSAAEMEAAIHEAHRFHKKAASHAQGAEGILNAVRGGIDSIEHGIFMNEQCLDEMLAGGVYLVPTCAALINIVRHADRGIPDYVVEKARRVKERHAESVKMFFRAGGKLAMGTDAGTPFNDHGDNSVELRYMVDYGVSTAGALIAATASAAALMDLKDRGRIADNMMADILIVKGNPLENIDAVASKENHLWLLKNGITVKTPLQTTE
jgi:imidazolonepropionase-like amidohydrolase